jgi:hypothetical protein
MPPESHAASPSPPTRGQACPQTTTRRFWRAGMFHALQHGMLARWGGYQHAGRRVYIMQLVPGRRRQIHRVGTLHGVGVWSHSSPFEPFITIGAIHYTHQKKAPRPPVSTSFKPFQLFPLGSQACLRQCIHSWVSESQLPHTTASLTFQSVVANNKLTILWGT